jgi:hypothetical protein
VKGSGIVAYSKSYSQPELREEEAEEIKKLGRAYKKRQVALLC